MSSPQTLADTLVTASRGEYTRFVAHWMAHPTDLDDAARLTGAPVIDALVAAAASHVALTNGLPVPAWTDEAERSLSVLWHAGPAALSRMHWCTARSSSPSTAG